MHRKILIGSDPRLRRKAPTVGAEQLASVEVQDLIDDLIDMTEDMDGLGMAAPQVGEHVRIVAVVQGRRVVVLVNPKIVGRSTETALGEEGCFSFPGLFGKVRRSKTIEVTALDRNGQPLTLHAEQMDARVIQHEIDHLDGILLPDRLAEQSGQRKASTPAAAIKAE